MTEKLPSADKLAENYETIIKQEVQSMPARYFRVSFLTQQDQRDFRSRERVFCYELYHKLRIQIESDEQPLELAKDIVELHGELPKHLYPNYADITLDFIIHQPTTPNYDLIATEVKCNFGSFVTSGTPDGIYKDLLSLCNMLNNGYKLGIFILFGKSYRLFLRKWVTNQKHISHQDYEMFRHFGNSIKILVKESAESKLVEKTLSEFLKDVDDAIESKAVSSQSKPLKAIEPTNPSADEKI